MARIEAEPKTKDWQKRAKKGTDKIWYNTNFSGLVTGRFAPSFITSSRRAVTPALAKLADGSARLGRRGKRRFSNEWASRPGLNTSLTG